MPQSMAVSPSFDDSVLEQVRSWLYSSNSESLFIARSAFLNELCHRKLLPIFVKPVYYDLILDLLRWLDDPLVCSTKSGMRYKCLDGLVRFTLEETILAPYAFLGDIPLTLPAVTYCVQSCRYLYSLSRLVEFLAFLGCRTSRKRLVTYNTVYPWPLMHLDSIFFERKVELFSNCGSGQSKFDRKNEISSLIVQFVEKTDFRADFLNRLQANEF